jgi:hypothetical protein
MYCFVQAEKARTEMTREVEEAMVSTVYSYVASSQRNTSYDLSLLKILQPALSKSAS